MNSSVTTTPGQQTKQFRSLSATFAELEASRQAVKSYPQIGAILATVYVAISVIIMAHAGLFVIFPILLFYAFWLPQIFIKGTLVLRPSADLIYCLLLPLIGCISTLWSDYKSVTLYHAIEFLSMIACTVIMTRVVDIKSYMRGILIGISIVMVETWLNGSYGTDAFSDSYALVGLFGSKNQVGFVAEIGIVASLTVLFSRTRRIEKLLYFPVPFALCMACLYLSKSASSAVSLATVIGAGGMAFMINIFPKHTRKTILGFSFAMMIISTLVVVQFGLYGQILKALGKDSTLTGRTYLWSEGIRIGEESPIVGHGYSAFWVEGSLEAEKLWFKFHIPGKNGFHFHNLYIQSFVDLGVVGICLIVMLVLVNCLKSLWQLLDGGAETEFVFAYLISVMFLIRGFVEVDLLGPFGIGPLLFFSIIPRLAKYKREQAIQSQIVNSKK